jgi:putative oxidoreductase
LKNDCFELHVIFQVYVLKNNLKTIDSVNILPSYWTFNEALSEKYRIMKKLLSIHYNAFAFNTAMLILRIAMGVLIMSHGYAKLIKFETMKQTFFDFMGLGPATSLILVIFAEFFCAIFIIIGLFTRVVSIPLIINMSVAAFKVHEMDFFDTGEKSSLFLTGFLVLLLCGPGRASVDGIASK